eukprot:13855150-Alexandrium_andersonii.AAC.1
MSASLVGSEMCIRDRCIGRCPRNSRSQPTPTGQTALSVARNIAELQIHPQCRSERRRRRAKH